ncbi:MAG TPA: hypothetical protein VFX85_12980 [Solirubrobacterales bacterium]|nr:hypothetical protein [Solirubrobacterales bacterium]
METIELLSHEETRRRVSIDFTLSDDQFADLTTSDGVVVPISVLTKEPRRNFDLRNESGAAVPVLGRDQNAEVALVALMGAALDALPSEPEPEAFELILSDLRQVVFSPPASAADALGLFIASAEEGNPIRSAIWDDSTCRSLLDVLHKNYVLFAALPQGGPNRRILKYSYGDDFPLTPEGPIWSRFSPRRIAQGIWLPDRSRSTIACPAWWRAASFHAEIAIPEALRMEFAFLHDFATDVSISELDADKNRASLYALRPPDPDADVEAYLQIAPERRGMVYQAAATGVVVSALLWLGVHSGLDSQNPGPAVSLLLAGAALYSGISAARAEHILVTKLFAAFRRWLGILSLTAVAASATLAMGVPSAQPIGVWRVCAIISTIAALRLSWSAIRAPR